MKTLLLLLLPAVLGNSAVKWCFVNERILGGERADKSEFPGVVFLRETFWNGSANIMNFCAGSVINKHWVLTAAHCLVLRGPSDEFRSLWVYPAKGSSYHISSNDFIIHEKYDVKHHHNDIALIRLPVPMSTIDPRSKITPIPKQNQGLTSNEVTLVGWGGTSAEWHRRSSDPNLAGWILVHPVVLEGAQLRQLRVGSHVKELLLSLQKNQNCSTRRIGSSAFHDLVTPSTRRP
ncbi:chymotrypsin-1-like [Anabrus simplex]|uniref:chymotrypsin-1-like n=1 Tax=Anabrus simplex TaxID=316456 RepID=UPI0035A328E1